MSRLLAFALVVPVAFTAACGGEDENILPSVDAPGVQPDASVDADTPPRPTALFVGGDFNTTGILSRINVVDRTVETNVLAGVVGGDPWLRHLGSEHFIVNRAAGGNVTILGGSPLALVEQFSTGTGSNPQDVAVVGNKLYVPAYETSGVVVIDRTSRQSSTIALDGVNAANDPDGMPECTSAVAVGTKVFVACQRFDRSTNPWVLRGPGRIVVIDAMTDTVQTAFSIGTIDEPLMNPVGLLQPTPSGGAFDGDLLLPMVPSFSDTSMGCLARIRTRGIPAFNGCAATNMAMDGYVNRVSVSPSGDKAWLAVFRYQFSPFAEFGHVRSLDLMTGALGAPVTTSTNTIVDVASCPGGYVVMTDTAGTAGVRIFKDGVETTTAALDLGRVPNQPNSLVCF